MGRIFGGGAPDFQSREPDFQSRDPEFETRDPCSVTDFQTRVADFESREPPKFLAQVYCGKTAGWIKMVQATSCQMTTQPPPQKGGGAPSPIFGPFLLRPDG